MGNTSGMLLCFPDSYTNKSVAWYCICSFQHVWYSNIPSLLCPQVVLLLKDRGMLEGVDGKMVHSPAFRRRTFSSSPLSPGCLQYKAVLHPTGNHPQGFKHWRGDWGETEWVVEVVEVMGEEGGGRPNGEARPVPFHRITSDNSSPENDQILELGVCRYEDREIPWMRRVESVSPPLKLLKELD